MVARRLLRRLPAPGPRYPHVNLAHRAEDAGMHELDNAMVVFRGMDLDAHLRGDFPPSRLLANPTGLGKVVG